MNAYSDLLRKAVDSISNTFHKRAAAALLSGRGAVLPEKAKQVSEATDFELITWLVIHAPY